jgi:hypothetical protein
MRSGINSSYFLPIRVGPGVMTTLCCSLVRRAAATQPSSCFSFHEQSVNAGGFDIAEHIWIVWERLLMLVVYRSHFATNIWSAARPCVALARWRIILITELDIGSATSDVMIYAARTCRARFIPYHEGALVLLALCHLWVESALTRVILARILTEIQWQSG